MEEVEDEDEEENEDEDDDEWNDMDDGATVTSKYTFVKGRSNCFLHHPHVMF